MYERMLDKSHKPTNEEFLRHCGAAQGPFEELDRFLSVEMNAGKLLRFPYGNKYGWGFEYRAKGNHVCDVFAESGAFTVMLRLTNEDFEKDYGDLSDYARLCIDKKYPCGDGGWIHYRVLTNDDLGDIERLLSRKLKKR